MKMFQRKSMSKNKAMKVMIKVALAKVTSNWNIVTAAKPDIKMSKGNASRLNRWNLFDCSDFASVNNIRRSPIVLRSSINLYLARTVFRGSIFFKTCSPITSLIQLTFLSLSCLTLTSNPRNSFSPPSAYSTVHYSTWWFTS